MNSWDIVNKLCQGFQKEIQLSKSVRSIGFSLEFDHWNRRDNFHASFSWAFVEATGISYGYVDLDP